MASVFKVETGIPLPEDGGTGRRPRYPFAEMAIGHSFFVPGDAGTKVHSAASQHRNRHGRGFTVRKVEGGYRVWRVS